MTITIKGEIHSSKNSRQIFKTKSGGTILAKSKAAKSDEQSFALQLGAQLDEWKRMEIGKQYPLFVVFYFVRATKRRWDFANLVQGVADGMVKAGYIPDDDVEHFIPVYGGYEINKDSAGVDFWIE